MTKASEGKMAITVEEALGNARGHLESDGIELYAADRGYVASVDRAPDDVRPGEMPILIDRETGEEPRKEDHHDEQ